MTPSAHRRSPWLTQVAASPDLLREGLRIADDALTHSELERIVRGEVRHRDFGWTLLDWLLDTDAHGQEVALDGAVQDAGVVARSS